MAVSAAFYPVGWLLGDLYEKRKAAKAVAGAPGTGHLASRPSPTQRLFSAAAITSLSSTPSALANL